MSQVKYFIETGSLGQKPIEGSMFFCGGQLLTSVVINAMNEEMRVQFMNQLAMSTNSVIVQKDGKSAVFYPNQVGKVSY